MPRALLALCAICGALVWPVAADAGNSSKDYSIGVSVQSYPWDPCSQAINPSITMTFAGVSSDHIVLKMQDGVPVGAHVDASQSGFLYMNYNSKDYIGALSYSSKTNLNNQNSVASVSFNIAAISTDLTSTLVFQVNESVNFNGNDPDPVKATSQVTAISCPS